MRKLGAGLIACMFVIIAGAALADDGNPTTSIVDQRQATHPQELAAKNPGPKRGPVLPPPRPIDGRPVDQTDTVGTMSVPVASVGALVPVAGGGSAIDEKSALEREMRRLATRLK